MKLNEKIQYYRKAAHLSQEELAAQVGVSRQSVSKWELGAANPEVDKLLALARAFGVTTDELLIDDEPSWPDPAPDTEPAAYDANYSPAEEDFDQRGDFWADLVHQYSWLAGVCAVLSCLGLVFVGGLVRTALGRIFEGVFQMFGGLGESGVVSIVEGIAPLEQADVSTIYSIGDDIVLKEAIVTGTPTYYFGSTTARAAQGTASISPAVLIFGLCAVIVVIALAVVLHRRNRE